VVVVPRVAVVVPLVAAAVLRVVVVDGGNDRLIASPRMLDVSLSSFFRTRFRASPGKGAACR
jgi:hypothetical protein